MDFTCELSKCYSVVPFEILKQDKDAVIMLINYYILKSQENNRPNLTGEDNTNLNDKDSGKEFWSLL